MIAINQPIRSRNIDLSSIFIARDRQIGWFKSTLQEWLTHKANESRTITFLDEPSPNNHLPNLIVMLYGKGGFGKTTLLNKYHKTSLEHTQLLISKIIDWEIATTNKGAFWSSSSEKPLDAFKYFEYISLEIAHSLGRKADDFKSYKKAYKELEDANNKVLGVLNDLQSEDKFAWLRSGIGDLTVILINHLWPDADVAIDEKNAKLISEAVGGGLKFGAEQLAVLRAKIKQKLGEQLSDYLEPQKKLALALGSDLQKLANKKKILIFFDTYEVIDDGDSYLKLLMMASGSQVGWVIAGRTNLWAGRDFRLRSLKLEYGYKDIVDPRYSLSISFSNEGEGEFTQGDIERYFHLLHLETQCPKLKPDEVAKILQVTKGIPLAVKIAAGIFIETLDLKKTISPTTDGTGEIIDGMVRRYLLHTKSDLKERIVLYGLSMLRQVDQPESVAAILQIPIENRWEEYDAELRRLHRRYSFIFTEKEQPTLHQDVRFFLRNWLLERRSKPEIIEVSKRAEIVLEQKLAKLEKEKQFDSLGERFENSIWTDTFLNITEQKFWTNPDAGYGLALPFLLASAIYVPNLSHEMIQLFQFFESELDQRQIDILKYATQASNTAITNNSKSIEGLLILEQMEISKFPYFQSLIGHDFTEELRAVIFWRLGNIFSGKDDVKSFEWYKLALNILPKNKHLRKSTSDAAQAIATNHYLLSRNEEAIEFYSKAYKIYPNNIRPLIRVGRAHTNLGNNKKAISYFQKVMKIEPINAEAILGLGTAYRYINLEKAIEYTIKATEYNKLDADSFDYLGLLYRDKLNIAAAINAHMKAKKLKERPTTYFFLALLYAYKNDTTKASSLMRKAKDLLDHKEYKGKIRAIWINVIILGWLVDQKRIDKALELITDMKQYINTKRLETVVVEHVTFLLTAYNYKAYIPKCKKILLA